MAITTASQSQIGQRTSKNSQIVTSSVRLINSGGGGSISPTISSIVITDSGYNNLDETVAATSNSYIRILGTGFQSTANVFLNGTMVPTANITFVSSSELRAVLPVSNTGNYAVSVYNSNSAGALYSSSFVISAMPQWLTSATLANVASNTVFSNTLVTTSDSSVTYSNTTILPTGITLLSNGYYFGNISVGTDTTYTFDVKATDLELQDQTKTFNIKVTTDYSVDYLVIAGGGGGGAGGGPPTVGGAGGGGAGGFLSNVATFSKGQTYTITIGGGGIGAFAPGEVNTSTSGANSSFTGPNFGSPVVARGGGFGGGRSPPSPGSPGGSGGGGSYGFPSLGGNGITGQGNPGGRGAGPSAPIAFASGGGGGAGGPGVDGISSPKQSGAGGIGQIWPFTGSRYAGGGGGGGGTNGTFAGAGGAGGGGKGAAVNENASVIGNGTTNTGGGGGGGVQAPVEIGRGGAGGSGIVIIAIPTPNYPGSAPGATVTTPPAAPGKTVLTFNSSGTYTA
jgi:hypothetical protein